MPSDESKGSQLDAIGSLAQRQLDNTCEMPTGTELSASGERRTVDDKRDVDLLQVVDQGLPTPYSTRSAYS